MARDQACWPLRRPVWAAGSFDTFLAAPISSTWRAIFLSLVCASFYLFIFSNSWKKFKKKHCRGRELNPGCWNHNPMYYHYTTSAAYHFHLCFLLFFFCFTATHKLLVRPSTARAGGIATGGRPHWGQLPIDHRTDLWEWLDRLLQGKFLASLHFCFVQRSNPHGDCWPSIQADTYHNKQYIEHRYVGNQTKFTFDAPKSPGHYEVHRILSGLTTKLRRALRSLIYRITLTSFVTFQPPPPIMMWQEVTL